MHFSTEGNVISFLFSFYCFKIKKFAKYIFANVINFYIKEKRILPQNTYFNLTCTHHIVASDLSHGHISGTPPPEVLVSLCKPGISDRGSSVNMDKAEKRMETEQCQRGKALFLAEVTSHGRKRKSDRRGVPTCLGLKPQQYILM